MDFTETLRQARKTRVAILHEFWVQYDEKKDRVHAFFEGQDDATFYSFFISHFLPKRSHLCTYICGGKGPVFESFKSITTKEPGAIGVIFFVDKDLDDILGVPWPTDPRIFVTDVYSIENYLVSRRTVEELYTSGVRLSGVNFDESVILDRFESELERFQRSALSVMAWFLALRRRGKQPNLNNVNLNTIYSVSDSCRVGRKRGARLALLKKQGGTTIDIPFRELLQTTRELSRLPPKRVVRGKFEAWFFVEFWKKLAKHLGSLARETGGRVTTRLILEHSTFHSTLARYTESPPPLEAFLRVHLPPAGARSSEDKPHQFDMKDKERWWRRISRRLISWLHT